MDKEENEVSDNEFEDNSVDPRKKSLDISQNVMHRYLAQILPSVPKLMSRLPLPDWLRVLDIIADKDKVTKVEYRSSRIKKFVTDLFETLQTIDSGSIKYCLDELSRVKIQVNRNHRGKSVDLESLILSSVVKRKNTLADTELSRLNDILFKAYLQGESCSYGAVGVFEKFSTAIDKLPQEFRAQATEYGHKILSLKKPAIDEPNDRSADQLTKKGEVLLNYIDALSENIHTLKGSFPQWVDQAIEKSHSLEKLGEYFRDTHQYFKEDLETLTGGLPISKIHGRLLAYVQALTGRVIKIEPSKSPNLNCSLKNDTFLLPSVVNVKEDDEDNFGIYKAIASYQAGALMFGTYELNPKNLPDKLKTDSGIENLFDGFSNPEFARGLFELIELTRINYRLEQKFPGLVSDLSVLNNHLSSRLKERKKNLSLLERIQELTLSSSDSNVKKSKEDLSFISPEVQRLRTDNSAVQDTLEATLRIYNQLKKRFDLDKEQPEENIITIDLSQAVKIDKATSPSHLVAEPDIDAALGKRFRYPEWNETKKVYQDSFVQVFELKYPQVSPNNYVAQVVMEDSSVIKNLRKIFESLKPEDFVRVRKQLSGEIDYDLAVRAKAEQAAGITPSEKIYSRDFKNSRSVASIVLAENSGSLRKFLDLKNPNLRIMDIIKRAQIYFSLALEAVGDSYALATFSGETEKKVEFYLIKDFNELYNQTVRDTIGSIQPLQQNRDGAGIRHAAHLLNQRSEKTKLLFYLMEGVPHDFGYEGEYAIADTKKAIIEAKRAGCIPVVIASGKIISDSVRSIADHCIYRELSDPSQVPKILPQLYQRITF